MAHHTSDRVTSTVIRAIPKEFNESLAYKIGEIKRKIFHRTKTKLLTLYKVIIDGVSQDIYPIAETDYNSKWCSLHEIKNHDTVDCTTHVQRSEP